MSEMLDHHSLSFCGFGAQIRKDGFEPGLIGTHANIYGSVAAIRQAADQCREFLACICRIGVDKRREHDPLRTVCHAYVTLCAFVIYPAAGHFWLRLDRMQQRRDDLMVQIL
jgi:hypothetical protein